MTDAASGPGHDAERQEIDFRAQSIRRFAGARWERYARRFEHIERQTGWGVPQLNAMAFLLGPIWASARGLWAMFAVALVVETVALVQIARGAWGNLGAEFAARAQGQAERADAFRAQAENIRAAGGDPERVLQLADNLEQAARASLESAAAAQTGAQQVLLGGLALVLASRLAQAALANTLYERQWSAWRASPETVPSGLSGTRVAAGLAIILVTIPLTVAHFSGLALPQTLVEAPTISAASVGLGEGSTSLYGAAASQLDTTIDAIAARGATWFGAITGGITLLLNAMSAAFVDTPWPVVFTLITICAFRLAGPRVAVFTAASLAYILLLDLWELSMQTVALVGAAALICVAFGVPLGIWFGKSMRAYRAAEPLLDLMQTLPAFVYLIPVIAFFGTGNPPGIIATIVFGAPPVIRLTALGIRGVSREVREAAFAFGASRWRVLFDVELPLATPSILTGINQTILMCLSMVVIISLIGGGGLGKVVLEALQYAAKGQGLLGGIAILLCAMIIDRIVQGAFQGRSRRTR